MAAAATASAILLCALLFAGTQAQAKRTEVTVGGGSVFFDVQFCVEALGSDDRSADAGMNYGAYSAIAADLLTANATTTAAKIDALLLRRGNDATARCLRSCQGLYGGVVRRQPGCAAAVRGRRNGEGTSCLERAVSAAMECEDGFGKSKLASPVTMENEDAFKLAKLAVALLTMAH
ncbi:hypothetical protein HU200_030440 [Digitaria exilis]|uniref:Pectinesterase inhibitor domain-containing protein n=1 Tax=Digitaria exilis TaxID=1010633 RepID=A0A835BX74_9POAL|nr:hypothetical protein HU200_030440 [Digitaria exilis]CAB3462949.1 unnamed protein product [Digitaria exilis]